MALPDALNTLTLREPQDAQNGRGGKYDLPQPSQRCKRSSPSRGPSQKCCVSGGGCGKARPGSGMGGFPLFVSVRTDGGGRSVRLQAAGNIGGAGGTGQFRVP